jgi:hypothetical protein
LNLQGNTTYVFPGNTGARIEVHSQLVRVIEIVRTHGVRVELDASQVDDPRETCRIIDDDFFGRATRRK